MPQLTPREIQSVVPGESMTKEKGVLPFDKPARVSNPSDGVQLVFDAMTEPRAAQKLMKALEKGATIDHVVDSMMMMLHGEGIVSPQALPIMAPAVATIIEEMARIANAPIKYSEEPDPWSQPDEDEVEKIVQKITGTINEETPDMEETPEETPMMEEEEETPMGGLMTPPEGM